MDLNCPQCHQLLGPQDINLAEGVAMCPTCGTLTRLSALMGGGAAGQYRQGAAGDEHWRQLPKGCRVNGWPGDVTLCATSRSIFTAIFMLFFTVFWNAITWLFVAMTVAGFYVHLVGPLPAWLGNNGPFSGGMSMPLAVCFFMLVFLTPFVLVGIGTVLIMLTSLFGDVRLQVLGDDASVSTGIGFLRWRRKFKASEVTVMSIGLTTWSQNNQQKPIITIEAGKTIRFGSMLSMARMQWMASAGRLVLLTPDAAEVTDLLAMGSSGTRNDFAPAPFPIR